MRAAALLGPICAAAALVLLACDGREGGLPPQIEFLSSEQTRALSLPFSDAVRVGPLIFVSGQIGSPPGSLELAPGGMGPQARQSLENIRSILERNGSGMDRVVKCTVFLLDMSEWADFNEVYVEFFPEDPPARSALGASGLAVGARVEVECIAAVGASASP
jgi:reactive intermediate/imine deaminase